MTKATNPISLTAEMHRVDRAENAALKWCVFWLKKLPWKRRIAVLSYLSERFGKWDGE